jgi:hypothetical protein
MDAMNDVHGRTISREVQATLPAYAAGAPLINDRP